MRKQSVHITDVLVGLLLEVVLATLLVVLADVAAPGRQGAAMGIFRSTGDLGAVVGPLALGLALDHGGAGAASLSLAAVAAVSALAYLVLIQRPAAVPAHGDSRA